MLSLREQFGQIDIYLFDQILRGNITQSMRVFDAGCGYGRNLVYLLREGFDVSAIDANPQAVQHVRRLAASLAPQLPEQNFRVGQISNLPFGDATADLVLCSAVLHFSHDERQFRAMANELWRVLAPGGMLFCRLGSTIGMQFESLGERRFRMPGGPVWFLVDEGILMSLTSEWGGELVDPLKTTVVQGQRCMTTWVLRKPDSKSTE